MRLANLIKKKFGKIINPDEQPSQPVPETKINGTTPSAQESKPGEANKLSISEISKSEAMGNTGCFPEAAAKIASRINPEAVYGRLIKEAGNLMENVRKGNFELGGNLTGLFSQLKELIVSDQQDLLELADKATPINYLCGHIVNVVIFSLRLGFALKKSAEELTQLTWAAFLHDLGMIDLLPAALESQKFSVKEKIKFRSHSVASWEKLQRLNNLPAGVKTEIGPIILQVHERWLGQGYPQALREKEIHPLARLLALADTYEALTHPRNWRQRYIPYQAIKLLIEEGGREFDPSLLKSLISSFSLFPTGSYVRLSSGEIGKVVKVFSESPTRPQVRALVNSQGQKIKEEKIVDLSQNYMLNVEGAVDETSLKIDDGKYVLALRLSRWWTE
ncbi:MAG: HD domain-containing phosphohydrolase [Elusimicrobiota bacterium]